MAEDTRGFGGRQQILICRRQGGDQGCLGAQLLRRQPGIQGCAARADGAAGQQVFRYVPYNEVVRCLQAIAVA